MEKIQESNDRLQQMGFSKIPPFSEKSCMENVSAFLPIEEVCICFSLNYFSAIKSPNISNFFRKRSGYISDFTLISPEKNLTIFNLTKTLFYKNN